VLDDDGKVLAIEKHRLQSGENTVTLVVDGKPARGGIDPLDKLIDRDQSDNVVPVSQ
jgi:ABC-2 type transport system permease protein